jgi:hypothetical protein
MVKQHANVHSVQSNEMLACALLRYFNRHEQSVILSSVDNDILKRVFETAIAREDYEICQVIKDLMHVRRKVF